VVMRILAKGETMPLEDMALSPRNYNELTNIISKPYGMILCVGPTGSGKQLHYMRLCTTLTGRTEKYGRQKTL